MTNTEKIEHLRQMTKMILEDLAKLERQIYNESIENKESRAAQLRADLMHLSGDYYNSIVSKSRTMECRIRRQCVAYFLSVRMDYPLVQVGIAIGNRHHSTIINGNNRVSDALDINDEYFLSFYKEVEEKYLEL
jgi:chromosomal replication initiation ATPase DnaA